MKPVFLFMNNEIVVNQSTKDLKSMTRIKIIVIQKRIY